MFFIPLMLLIGVVPLCNAAGNFGVTTDVVILLLSVNLLAMV